jgi:Histidine kinase-, DNA gyrase B-, and HSP90-like ATPase
MGKPLGRVNSIPQIAFGPGFLQDHLGRIIDDPQTATMELIANSYDAGASKVDVRWPALPGDLLSISDNGTGMTREELETRWRTFSYDRIQSQGPFVKFPSDVNLNKRVAFGHNGKGRFSPFCFADEYQIETRRDGNVTCATVLKTDRGLMPFDFRIDSQSKGEGHGTTISLTCGTGTLPDSYIRDLIGYKFAVDPSFEVFVNNLPVRLLNLREGVATRVIEIKDVGTIHLHRLDPQKQERTMRLKGIAWWVNTRMVGEPSWEGLDGEGQYLDGRSTEAKRYSFIVESDVLLPYTKADWSGFKGSPNVESVKQAVHNAVVEELKALVVDDRKALKKAAIAEHRTLIKQLPPVSQWQIGRFLDEAQEKCPNLTEKELARTVEIWGKLEQSRSGYDLLRQLARCSSEDLDTWNTLMLRWSASNAEVVLSELDRRLTVIRELQDLIRDKNSDEVHDLQPLFERGLWMFGPEYESVEFTSNRGMTHVVQEFFGKRNVVASRKRPDFVVLPDSSIGLYAADEFADGEVCGVRKILIVELKKGGYQLSQKELDQARDYARELRSKGCAQVETVIEAIVLGASIDSGVEQMSVGDRTTIKPLIYDVLLKRAHSRVFNLASRIRESAPETPRDAEMDDVLNETRLSDLFSDDTPNGVQT